MKVKKSQNHLGEPLHDLRLGEMLPLRVLDLRVNIAPLAVHHHDVELLLPVNKRVFEGNDVCMP